MYKIIHKSMDLLDWKISHMYNTHFSFVPKQRYLRRLIRSSYYDIWSWILFRPERRREAEMPMDLCLFSNSPDPIVPIFGMMNG